MLNVAVIMGRLTRDPELRRTNSGKPVASFTVAVDRDYAPDGQERETDFIDCVAWQGTAEFVDKYFNKGSMIVVSGRLQLRNWTDKDGNKRRSAEILASNVYFGEGKKSQENHNPTYNQNSYQGPAGNPGAYQNQLPQTYQNQGGYPPAYLGQQQAPNMPQYNQQGFGGYQQPAFQGQGYQHTPPGFTPLDDDGPLPF